MLLYNHMCLLIWTVFSGDVAHGPLVHERRHDSSISSLFGTLYLFFVCSCRSSDIFKMFLMATSNKLLIDIWIWHLSQSRHFLVFMCSPQVYILWQEERENIPFSNSLQITTLKEHEGYCLNSHENFKVE